MQKLREMLCVGWQDVSVCQRPFSESMRTKVQIPSTHIKSQACRVSKKLREYRNLLPDDASLVTWVGPLKSTQMWKESTNYTKLSCDLHIYSKACMHITWKVGKERKKQGESNHHSIATGTQTPLGHPEMGGFIGVSPCQVMQKMIDI